MVYNSIVLSFGLLIVIVLLATLAIRIRVPYAVVLVIGGIVLGFVPALPRVVLDPDIVLLLFLPPLIYSSAWSTSWSRFKSSLLPILIQAVGLVLVTVVLVAVVAHLLRPSLPWSVAFVMGAVVSPTDSVAANTIMQNVGLAHQISTIIEGESLVNDSTALVAYQFGVKAVSGSGFSFGGAILQFLLVSLGGVAVGLLISFPIAWLHRRIDDTPSQITLTVLTPFATYLLAQGLGFSGVLATVTAGLYLGRQSSTFFSANTRLQSTSFWNVLVFLFNGLIFLLIGLQLHTLIEQIPGNSFLPLLGYAGVISLTVILVRVAWSFAANGILSLLNSISHRLPNSVPATTIIGWAGMRGGVSLATALALPNTIANGMPFPDRDLVILVTFVVIFSTLVLQGLTFGPLIQLLHLDEDSNNGQEVQNALQKATEAALQEIDLLAQELKDSDDLVQHVRAYYKKKLELVSEDIDTIDRDKWKMRRSTYRQFLLAVRLVQRSTLIQLRNEGNLDDDDFHRMERDFDLEEERLEGR